MKPILMKHGGKILFAVTLLICGGIMAYISAETEPASFGQLSGDKDKLAHAIADRRVSKDYHFSTENVKATQQFLTNEKRGAGEAEEAPKSIVYQRPSKPGIDLDTVPKSDAEKTTTVEIATGNLSDLSAKADHGVVYVTYKLPALNQKAGDKNVWDIVRVEIFRGLSADKIDTKAPFATIDYNPEEPLNMDLAKDDPATNTSAQNEENESVGERRRRHHTDDAPAAAPAKKEDAKKEDVPAEFSGVKVYADTHVQPKSTYFYKARLISRLNVEPGKPVVDHFDKDNKPDHFTVYKAPKGLDATPPAKAGSKTLLFATPITSDVSATAPAEYEIRLAGSDGDISEPGTRATLINENYKGMFVVRVWVTEAQEWREVQLTVPKGDTLSGEARSQAGKKPITYAFDTKYELEEIKWKQGTKEVVEKVMRMKDGVPEKDKDTGKPIYDEEKKIVDSIPVKVAFLKDLNTNKVEEFPQSNDFKRRDAGIEIIKKLAEQEEKNREEQKKNWDKVKERIKQQENAIKQKAAALEAENERLNGQNNGGPRGPGGGYGPGGPNGPGGAGGPPAPDRGPVGPMGGGPGGPTGPGGPGGGGRGRY